jgi:hypothetical protein
MKGKLRRSFYPEDLGSLNVLQLNGWGIPFVNNVIYLGVTFDRRMTWRHRIERTVAKVLRMYVRTYSLFRGRRLGTYIKLTLYRALFRSVMTYACPTWEYAALLEILTSAHQSVICWWLSKFLTYMTIHIGESNENRKTEIKIRNIAPLSCKLADMLPML